jgi:hypothetical protein
VVSGGAELNLEDVVVEEGKGVEKGVPEGVEEKVTAALATVSLGRIMPEAELRQYRAFFEDGSFGQLIWLAQEGVLIVPSHMGARPIRAMHGYHPTDPQSYATLFSSHDEVPADITHIPHICHLMDAAVLRHADKNKSATRTSPQLDEATIA